MIKSIIDYLQDWRSHFLALDHPLLTTSSTHKYRDLKHKCHRFAGRCWTNKSSFCPMFQVISGYCVSTVIPMAIHQKFIWWMISEFFLWFIFLACPNWSLSTCLFIEPYSTEYEPQLGISIYQIFWWYFISIRWVFQFFKVENSKSFELIPQNLVFLSFCLIIPYHYFHSFEVVSLFAFSSYSGYLRAGSYCSYFLLKLIFVSLSLSLSIAD